MQVCVDHFTYAVSGHKVNISKKAKPVLSVRRLEFTFCEENFVHSTKHWPCKNKAICWRPFDKQICDDQLCLRSISKT